MTTTLLISAGTGPAEVREFVGKLAQYLIERCRRAGVLAVVDRVVGSVKSPKSIALQIPGQAPVWLRRETGTHALVARRERTRGNRKRWFASVSLLMATDDVPEPLQREQIRVKACRSGGPGGQNVNKRSTAVLLEHIPTGMSLRVSEQRTQGDNLRVGLERLRGRIRAKQQALRQAHDRVVRLQHYRLERGRPVRVYHLGEDGSLQEDE